MNFKNLFNPIGVTHVGLIGAGAFGQSFLAQSRWIPQIRVPVVCDRDGTDYEYDAPQLHAPIARIIEMPEIMRHRDDGGIFHREGIVDMVNCLRRPDEISLGGGVFIIIKCQAKKAWQFLKNKGHLVSRDGTRAMIFRPYHLLGVETATSVLMADFLNQATGSTAPKPRVDVVARTSRTLEQGYRLTLKHDHSLAGGDA